jgi:hypothetical protein
MGRKLFCFRVRELGQLMALKPVYFHQNFFKKNDKLRIIKYNNYIIES